MEIFNICRFIGETKLESSDRIVITKEAEVYSVTVKKVKKIEEGIINIRATNEAGPMSASARLRVTGKFNFETLDLWKV